MKLYFRSFLLILALYGLVFAVGDAYLARHSAPVWIAMVFPIVMVGLQYAFGPALIEFFLKIRWDDRAVELPVRNREFLRKLCAARGIPTPRIGIIESGTPNAFTFGHVASDARVVVTTGLLKILTPEEANTVLAHEMGHVEHGDFIVMTLAALVPLLLYQLYVFSRNDNRTRPVALGAYLAYWVSQYIVFMLSRTREYFADQYSAQVTHAPDLLASALVKIAYGIFQADGVLAKALDHAAAKEKRRFRRERVRVGSLALMGISNLRSGQSLALCGGGTGAAAAMRWDLMNPWARLYQLNSTHPLTAFRIQALNRESEALHRAVSYPLPADRRIHWGGFPLQLLLWIAPWACAIGAVSAAGLAWRPLAAAAVSPILGPILLVLTGFTWMLRTSMRYSGEFQPSTIARLMEDVEVSEMQPRAVRLEGTIIGFGVPGAFYCADLVLRDSSGIVFVAYKQSLPLARFFFGLTAAAGYIGQKVSIEGWFRRSLRPYVEISRLTGEDGRQVVTGSRWILHTLAALVSIAGVLWLAMAPR